MSNTQSQGLPTSTVQEKGKFPSQPHQNPKGIHEVEAQEGNLQRNFEVLRQVKVNIPLLDMIKQCKSPVKYKDSGCPTISVSIGGTCVEKALLDLGANRSVKIPRGMIEDVLVQVDKFYYPVDFVVLDTDPLNGVMQLTFGNMTLSSTSSICTRSISIRRRRRPEEVCMIDTLVEEHCDKRMQEDLIESFGDLDEGLPEPSDLLATLLPWRRREEILPLFNEEENKDFLRRCKKAIGWQISDLKGINPLVCTHHIYMEDEAKPVRQPQRRLNPHMQEVVRAEVLKLLQAGIIYPISDSPWVVLLKLCQRSLGSRWCKMIRRRVSTRLTTGWRVCIDYRRLNADKEGPFPVALY
ncbi:hypothetical protein CK203_058700 [Vitis vinifera]|uniref:Transposon Ty3-I Gag-Pol polyprotein n=1 Tax=Vitis vinifera TaxID=29760 RepID=A0A438GLL1_VITVI|nr:hypothetical protein CK203_058700 [Vitis vinifera]